MPYVFHSSWIDSTLTFLSSALSVSTDSVSLILDSIFPKSFDVMNFSSSPRNFRERSNLFVLESCWRMSKTLFVSFSSKQLWRTARNSPKYPMLISVLKIVLNPWPPIFSKSWYFSSSVLHWRFQTLVNSWVVWGNFETDGSGELECVNVVCDLPWACGFQGCLRDCSPVEKIIDQKLPKNYAKQYMRNEIQPYCTRRWETMRTRLNKIEILNGPVAPVLFIKET